VKRVWSLSFAEVGTVFRSSPEVVFIVFHDEHSIQETNSVEKKIDSTLSRRRFLSATGAALGGSLLLPGLTPTFAAEKKRKRSLRLAHITDIHIQPERGAAKGFAQVLNNVQSLDDKPSLIVTGGDAIMDALAASASRTKQQWKLWKDGLKSDCSLPIEPVIGNHDVWGWNKIRSKTTGKEKQWGKQWALDEFEIPERYRSFDRNGWHFIILDSIHPDPESVYRGQLDEKQFAWLENDLKKTAGKKPVVVVSHIPILTVAPVEFSAALAKNPNRRKGTVHQDANRLVQLFKRNANVKLCLSGHLHLTERIQYAGVTYICSGAVSGNWWKGNHHHVEEGYNVIDLFDDGSVGEQYIPYGWKVQK
jgi:3',5'-cyclic-AMP phosphodiesterase